MNNNNYKQALIWFEKRFGDKTAAFKAIIRKLTTLPIATLSGIDKLIELCVDVRSIVGLLWELGSEKHIYHALIVDIILNKIDSHIYENNPIVIPNWESSLKIIEA